MRPALPTLCLAVSLALLNAPTQAQTVTHAEHAVVLPTVTRDANGFRSCGVRATVLAGGKQGWVYDFSVEMFPEKMGGILSAGKYTHAAVLSKTKRTAVHPGPSTFWIAASDQPIALTSDKFVLSDSPGFILGATDFLSAFETLLAITAGKQMQFAMPYKNEKAERIVSFAATMSKSDLDAVLSCTEGARKRIEKELEAEKPSTAK